MCMYLIKKVTRVDKKTEKIMHLEKTTEHILKLFSLKHTLKSLLVSFDIEKIIFK